MKPAFILIALVLAFLVGMGAQSYITANVKPDASGANLGASTPAYTSRYTAIDSLLTTEQRLDRLEREMKAARGQMGAQLLLRESDIQSWHAARVEDQKRITSLEVTGIQLFEICKR